ncbi:hypothetical protein HQ586_06375 [Candidatus Bathyarchaeota archaeon]|nr:hypothetical protein [Candidatus Bathyarchaeota archaeon]
MYKQPTFARPASMQMPAVWARSSDKQEIMREYGLGYWFQTQRRIPPAWPKIREWAPGAMIANLPSIVQTGVGPSGPTRTILPQLLQQRKNEHTTNISDSEIFAIDGDHSGQAQAPRAEQPQRTKEEPYFSQRPLLNLIRTRIRRT